MASTVHWTASIIHAEVAVCYSWTHWVFLLSLSCMYTMHPTMFANSFAAKSTITQGAILHAERGLIGHSFHRPFFCG